MNNMGEELRNTLFGSPNEMEIRDVMKVIFSFDLETNSKGNFQRNIPNMS